MSNHNGFTLIEVLIALTIFMVGLLAIAGMQASAINYNSTSTLRTSGAAIAQAVMEEALSLETDDPLLQVNATNAANLDPNNSDGDNNTATLTLPGGGTYTANWTVTINTPVSRIARIDVNAQDATGRLTTLTGYKRFTP